MGSTTIGVELSRKGMIEIRSHKGRRGKQTPKEGGSRSIARHATGNGSGRSNSNDGRDEGEYGRHGAEYGHDAGYFSLFSWIRVGQSSFSFDQGVQTNVSTGVGFDNLRYIVCEQCELVFLGNVWPPSFLSIGHG